MKDKWKKILLIGVLVVIIVAIVFVAINSSSGKKEQKIDDSKSTVGKVVQSTNTENKNETVTEKANEKKVIITKTDKGTKYAISNEKVKPDIVIGDNYYGTQLNDINLNFAQYEGKTIEIEGLYFKNEPYTFVGRYSTAVICADCPTGYSYFEYEWKGKDALPLNESESWMKIIGTLKKGNDGVEYYYIDAQSVEIMNEKGLDTVNN